MSVVFSYLSSLVLLLAVTAICASPVDRKSKFVSHKQNMDALRQWKCNTPQSKLVYVDDVLRDRGIHEMGVRYIPPAIVVRQCSRESGCCSVEGQTCQHQEREMIEYEIYVWPANTNKKTKMTLNYENHVSCVCR